MPRSWGFWTRGKLDILRDYLDAFTTTTKNKASELLYFDLFAGEPDNRDRVTEEPIEGSPWIALRTDTPPFTRLRFFELEHAPELEAALRAEFPGRGLKVHRGDSNETIHEILTELKHLNWAPAFAFIDPDGPDVHWDTLRALAKFKMGRKYKVELWILFAQPMFVRLLPADGKDARPIDMDRITAMFGTDEWLPIYRARVSEFLEPAEARTEYVNLMRWRMQHVLGYRWTHAFEVRNERGGPLYHMIFGTDNQAGNYIMSHLYQKALSNFPRMRQEAIDRRQGALRLFDDSEYRADEIGYAYEEPWHPYEIGGGR